MLKVNKEYASKAIRFLKIGNLFPYWVTYIESKKQNTRYVEHHEFKHWSDKDEITEVFGQTRFTLFLRCETEINPNDLISNIFREYLYLLKQGKKNEAESFVKKSLKKK